MEKILERYDNYWYAEKAFIASDLDSQGNWCQEYRKLKAKVEALSRSQRHLMGEQLDSLNVRELQQLEHQLEISLKHVRSRKNQVMFDSIAELQSKEKALQEQNENLEKQQIMEKQKAKVVDRQAHWDQAQISSPSLMAEANPTFNIGPYQGMAAVYGQHQVRTGNGLLPPWMFRPLNG
ncbi:unnamed protein product [Musa textilis]